ncbi:MAG TPA: hypothetical protein VK541_07290 [Pedobacter sp.]|uniref:hypothetical protein n=1 Tax=Pedobacter sp. TaxID=1411316 RepID=UPI002D15D3EE|nr:hypothetical protein [Pedobacter sp.]HMI02268.1 hypothetical protein [Pedobacter sp.]
MKLWGLTFFTVLFLIGSSKAHSVPEFDEVSIFLNVQRVGGIEVPALIVDQTVYLPVSYIFTFLGIRNVVSAGADSISGALIDPKSKFIIDKKHNRIVFLDKIYELQPDELISASGNLFLKSEYFGKVFGLNCLFSFRNLSVTLSTDLELPVIRELRQEQMRANVNKLKGQFKSDTSIGRSYPLFHFGTADYSVVTTSENLAGTGDTRLSLGLGGVIAGGETNVVLNHYSAESFSERQQYYLWRFANNDNAFAKQISAGKISGQSISSIYAPLVGIQLTNTPTTYRRSFGSYVLSNHTEPNWTVELYLNNVLVNYVKADAAGFYSFNVPLVYGTSLVKLRFYGLYGEERSSEQNISIPFNFLPKNEFEYTATTGMVEDGHQSRFSRFSSNFGLNTFITIGAGAEYLSSITSGTAIPFINTSARVLPNLLLSAEYDHMVRSKILLSYNLPSGLQLELNNTWYKKGQTAINNTFMEDRRISLSLPLRGKSFSAYSRITLEQFILPYFKYTAAEWLMSTSIGSCNTTINTFAFFRPDNDPYVYSNFSIAARFLKNTTITQQLQYEYAEKKLAGIKTELESRVFKKGYVNISFEKNFSSDFSNIEAGLRYDFSFARARASVRKSNSVITHLESVTGSLFYDRRSKYLDFNTHTSVGKGAIILSPYLDMNANGLHDAAEPRAPGLNVRINGGRIEKSLKDTTIRITDMEAYVNYNIELDTEGFERLAWQLPKKNYSIMVDPNSVKKVDVPVLVYGEVSGRITLKGSNYDQAFGRIIVNFYNDKSVVIASTLAESEGYFNYLGLLPGNYSARIDSAGLKKLNIVAVSGSLPFTIIPDIEGTVIDTLMFVVERIDEPDDLEKESN